MSFYYITAVSGESFISKKCQYAIKSLIRTGTPVDDIHVAVNNKQDRSLIKKLVPNIKNIHMLSINTDKYRWQYMSGKRKYAVLKPFAINKIFPNPIPDKYLVLFDGDVLWYKDPAPFLDNKKEKTWFHHGKDLGKRARIDRSQVRMDDYKVLSKWCRNALAYLLVKYKVKEIPVREVCSGFYILHPRDHVDLPLWDIRGCDLISDKFRKNESAGEQCPLNAALCKLKVDWHGGSRFLCLEHEEYFEHFFGDIVWKKRFDRRVKQMKLHLN